MKMKLPLIAAAAAIIATAAVTPAFAVTSAQAESTVISKYGGKLTAPTELEDQDGTQVFGVHLKAGDGRLLDVKVDVGSGAIVGADPDDPGGDPPGGAPGGGEGDN